MFLTKKAPVETPAPVQTKQPKKPPARVKCIQIDPALVDKIYVKNLLKTWLGFSRHPKVFLNDRKALFRR